MMSTLCTKYPILWIWSGELMEQHLRLRTLRKHYDGFVITIYLLAAKCHTVISLIQYMINFKLCIWYQVICSLSRLISYVQRGKQRNHVFMINKIDKNP
jgi:hypothetical protein